MMNEKASKSMAKEKVYSTGPKLKIAEQYDTNTPRELSKPMSLLWPMATKLGVML